MAIYAYLRVSTSNKSQTTDNQRKLISDAGFLVDEWVDESGVSGSVNAADRPAFQSMMEKLKDGDTVIAVAIDRLGRSASDILSTVDYFKVKGVKLRIMALDAVDLTSSTGRLLVTMLAAVAEMEKNLIVERVNAGLARSKEQGTVFGRPPRTSPSQLKAILTKLANKETKSAIAREFNMSLKTILNYEKIYLNNPEKVVEYEQMYKKQMEQIKNNKLKQTC